MSEIIDRLLQYHGELARATYRFDELDHQHRTAENSLNAWLPENTAGTGNIYRLSDEQMLTLGRQAAAIHSLLSDTQDARRRLVDWQYKLREIHGELSGVRLLARDLEGDPSIQADRWNGDDFIHTPHFVTKATGTFRPTSWHIDTRISLRGTLRSEIGIKRKTLFHVPLVDPQSGEPLVVLEEL